VEMAEAYRFITEELLDEMMTNIRVPEYYTRFCYEEFHPNDVEDIKEAGQWFLQGFFGDKNIEVWGSYVAEGVLNQPGELLTLKQIVQMVRSFHIRHNPIHPYSVEPLWATVDDDQGVAAFAVTWHQTDQETADLVMQTANVVMHLRRCSMGGWDIVQATLPFD
jgi:hypothetical protein